MTCLRNLQKTINYQFSTINYPGLRAGVGGIGGAVACDDIISFLKIFPKYKKSYNFSCFLKDYHYLCIVLAPKPSM
jgi:hypothetical protein